VSSKALTARTTRTSSVKFFDTTPMQYNSSYN
jgi:hypothetical protein